MAGRIQGNGRRAGRDLQIDLKLLADQALQAIENLKTEGKLVRHEERIGVSHCDRSFSASRAWMDFLAFAAFASEWDSLGWNWLVERHSGMRFPSEAEDSLILLPLGAN